MAQQPWALRKNVHSVHIPCLRLRDHILTVLYIKKCPQTLPAGICYVCFFADRKILSAMIYVISLQR